MGSIYCLYSEKELKPRYVGQTGETAEYRYRRHMAKALAYENSDLYEWMREVWRLGSEVSYHILQDDVAPGDLNFFETYWINQFAGLLNTRNNLQRVEKNTQVGDRVCETIAAKHSRTTNG